MSEKFNFIKDTNKKIISVVVAGKVEETDFKDYISQYKSNISGINPEEYTLKVDFKQVPITPQQLTYVLTDCLKMYKADKIKNVIVILSKEQIVVKMQINRLAKEVGIDNFEIVSE